MGLFSWLGGGNDRQLAEQTYAGRESATARAAAKRRQGHRRSTRHTTAQGQAWEDHDRRRDGGINRFNHRTW
jgi:hypothetical protein